MLTMAGIGISGGLQYLSPIRAQKESMNNAPADGSVTREPHEMQYVNLLDNTLVAYAMPGPILFTGEILAYAGATIEVVYDARLLTPSSDTAIVSTTNKSHTLLFDVANASNKGTLRLQIPPTPTSGVSGLTEMRLSCFHLTCTLSRICDRMIRSYYRLST
ncbi:hypothetical protein [Clavibacter michiganensis]|uniref:hypothetical protein n=1 Tax=Clavibacter michiganensis TaxID=28447 RepID=UPI0011801782|nr:hypothetical protein [Clavibacter michiganensis]MDO4099751.1 hypothetical protein [Clavibacter michiganensis]MDO4128619.1 hypothetical protein [Clavibacter michiganensis]NIY61303.1 hypothetical protein [Clavibacter michiganensis subsp. michiganensis]QXP02320.1 hypothetical protein KN218_12180 [Clavibacter michiganensis subsp. michiganensis]QXP05344.1 hypothetical protein KN200_12255 [Clavibacter michiganensis subsp. michiganensis]